jgi:hypothetical protein
MNKLLTLALALLLALVSVPVMAALPTEASTAFTTLSGNVTDIIAEVWPILASAVGGFVLFKLFRRGMNKI